MKYRYLLVRLDPDDHLEMTDPDLATMVREAVISGTSVAHSEVEVAGVTGCVSEHESQMGWVTPWDPRWAS